MKLRYFLGLWLLAAPLQAEPLVVFAAASLAGPLDHVAEAWEGDVVVSYAGSATHARHVAAGAPADVVILANEAWMDHLDAAGAIAPNTRRAVLTNELVLAGPAPQEAAPSLAAALDALPPGTRIATGLVEAVPVGIYARQTLETLGLYDPLAPQLVQVENARLALALVARGDVGAALIYASDAQVAPQVAVMARAEPTHHDPIIYSAAVTAQSGHPEAAVFLDHLASAYAIAEFLATGYGGPPE